MAIDAHVHVWSDNLERYPRSPGSRDSRPTRFTPEDLFTHTKPAGVDRVVLIQISFYRFDNSYMLESIKAHPGVFSGIALVDPTTPAPDRAMEELARHGVRGFRIVPGSAPETWLDTPGMHAMWSAGAKRRLAICPLINPNALPSVDRMCLKYPDSPVVIDHLARIGADGQIRDSDVRLLCGLARHKNVMVKVSAFYALGKKQMPYTDLVPLIRRVFEDYGPRRLMWASDSPFQVQNSHTYESSIALVRRHLTFLSNEDREWILGKTAASVFFSS